MSIVYILYIIGLLGALFVIGLIIVGAVVGGIVSLVASLLGFGEVKSIESKETGDVLSSKAHSSLISPEVHHTLAALHGPCPFLPRCEADWRAVNQQSRGLWEPPAGWVPRGFVGALGQPSEVELVLVLAEPSPPQDESYPSTDTFEAVGARSLANLRSGREAHHQALARIIRQFMEGTGGSSLDDILRRVFITESVFCSVPTPLSSTAAVPSSIEGRCADAYLFRLLQLFPNAEVVALGKKAQDRIRRLKRNPGAPRVLSRVIHAMHPTARLVNDPERSWAEAAREFRRRKGYAT
jgi:hypothetical protein